MPHLITSLSSFAFGAGDVESIQTTMSRTKDNLLQITYLLKGSIEKLRIPGRFATRQANRLWEHTCFEAFIRADGDASYYEFNFSPSSEWAAYSFRDYRDGEPIQDETCAPKIVVRRDDDSLELDAVICFDRLLAIRTEALLRIGLSAVIEAKDGTLSYWALKHPAAKPDFHHPDSFALELAFPSQSA
jgi:hypothetical protein